MGNKSTSIVHPLLADSDTLRSIVSIPVVIRVVTSIDRFLERNVLRRFRQAVRFVGGTGFFFMQAPTRFRVAFSKVTRSDKGCVTTHAGTKPHSRLAFVFGSFYDSQPVKDYISKINEFHNILGDIARIVNGCDDLLRGQVFGNEPSHSTYYTTPVVVR